MKGRNTFVIYFFLCVILPACRPHPFKTKFNKAKWNEKNDWEYPNRAAVLDDLLKYHQIKGLTYKQQTIQIGEPMRNDDDLTHPYYDIIVDFGSDIDPVYTKVLSITLNKDSVVTGYEVKEWRQQ